MPWWNRQSNMYSACDCRNCPISKFLDGVTISISCYKERRVWQRLFGHVGQWVTTISYSIGIVGAACLWGSADPKVRTMIRVRIAPPYLTDANEMRSRISCFVLWRLAIMPSEGAKKAICCMPVKHTALKTIVVAKRDNSS